MVAVATEGWSERGGRAEIRGFYGVKKNKYAVRRLSNATEANKQS